MIHWIVLLVTGISFLLSSYQQGLFYDKDIYTWHIGVALLCIAYMLYVFFRKKEQMPSPVYFTIFLIPLFYLISFTNAVTLQGAFDQFIQWTMFATFFIVLVTVKRNVPSSEKGMLVLLQIFGFYIAILPFLHSWGWVAYNDAILNGRFSSVFQYPNTYAAVTMAVLLFNIVFASQQRNNIPVIALSTLPLALYASTLFLSLSRGAMILLPIVWFIGLLALSTRHQFKYVLYTILAFAGGFIFFMTAANEWGGAGPAMQIVVWFAVSAVTTLGAVSTHLLVEKKLPEKFMQKRFAFVLPAAALLAGAALLIDFVKKGWVFSKLPENVQNRIQNIGYETIFEDGRFTFFFDALDMLKDAPIIGWGGDGWSVLYHGYQSEPYISNEVHSVVLEQLLNIGILGFLVGMAVLLLFAFNSIKSFRQQGGALVPASLIALLMLVGHGVIDFDFSFATIWLLFMLILTLAVPENPAFPGVSIDKRSIKFGAYGVAAILIGLSSMYAFRFEVAERKVEAVSQTNDAEEILNILSEARQWNPNELSYITNQVQVAVEQQKEELILELSNQFIEVEPKSREAWMQSGNSHASFGYVEEAMTRYNQALSYDPFNINIYQRMIRLTSGEASSMMQSGNPDQAAGMAAQATDAYERYQKNTQEFRKNPQSNYKDLTLTPAANFLAGQAYMIEGSYQKGIKVLKKFSENDGELYVRAQALMILAQREQGNQKQAEKRMNTLASKNNKAQAYVDAYQVFF
ncbi:O-antigen ligase family protein [Salibacterium halotolerans]|uniref:O-antigen ligase n=1 Tax=Salibacterium halotolerans TaxID=1884432 RepID=A0A1I5XX09_9BACI|nr:O-antigen ligase family protein [Salibacterium halotolerans]SFQ36257.1 O-antigen ligase [Salibacterium halotolerans]